MPECKIDSDGNKSWYINGRLHREGGPAVEYANGTKEWRINGKYHREDGPAIEFADGSKLWFVHGKQIHCKTNEEFLKLMKLKSFW